MVGCLLACLLNVPATCQCISGMDLLRQFYVLPHWDRSCRSNFLPHPVTVYWHWADQSQRWPYNARRLTGKPLECQFWSHWYDLTPKKSRRKRDSNPGSSALEADALTTRPIRRSGKMGTAQSVVCWADCPAWHRVMGSNLLWGKIFCGRGNFSLGVNMVSDSIPPKLFPMGVQTEV